MKGERTVAGLRCGEVLADLSAYLDGELDPARVARLQEHLRGCDVCERFGGEFRAVVEALRRHLAQAEPLSATVAGRLRRRLRRDLV